MYQQDWAHFAGQMLDKFPAVYSTGLQPTVRCPFIAPVKYRARSDFIDGPQSAMGIPARQSVSTQHPTRLTLASTLKPVRPCSSLGVSIGYGKPKRTASSQTNGP